MNDGANPTFAAPTVTGTATGWYDLQTMTMPDPSPGCDGGVKAQHYTLTVASAGSYTFTLNWVTGTDMDFGVMAKDGSYGAANCSDYLTTAGLSGAKPETFTIAALAAGSYVVMAMDYPGNGTATGIVQVTVRKN